jgi:ABC-2 type transport system ATP-binding protein
MPVDFPRRALFDEPDDVESYVARRSLGFTPADHSDQLLAHPARAAQEMEPIAADDDAARPRRASFAEPLTPDADEEKSTATEAGIGRRAMDPLPGRVTQPAPRPEIPAQVTPSPPTTSPEPRRSAPALSAGHMAQRATVNEARPSTGSGRISAYSTPVNDSATVRAQPAPPVAPAVKPAVQRSAIPVAAPTSSQPPPVVVQSASTTAHAPVRASAPLPQPAQASLTAQRPAQGTDRLAARLTQQPVGRRTGPADMRRTHPARRAVRREVPPIFLNRLVKSYNGKLAVRDLSFVVQPGRVTGFLGPNGAGKTTTMRILVGLTSPTAGTATFGDLPYADLPHPQQTVGCVLDASFHPARSGRNHLRVLAATAGADDRRIDWLLDQVRLGDVARQPVGDYSTGMRQRLALATAMLGKPDYLILDEPANGLDPEGIRWLRTFLRDFAASGRAVLVSSHLLNEIEATADDIVVISRGRLMAQMPMSELNLGEGTTRARVSDMRGASYALAAIGADVQTAADERGAFLRIHSHDVSQVGAVLLNSGIAVEELITERRDLEQEFFSMLDPSR